MPFIPAPTCVKRLTQVDREGSGRFASPRGGIARRKTERDRDRRAGPRDVVSAHALSETAKAYARKALSAATRRAYASHLRAWERWCRERGALPCPAAPALVANHLAELARKPRLRDAHRPALRDHPGARPARPAVRRQGSGAAQDASGHRPA